MRANTIYLFKVPFDNTYKNVFDFTNPSNTLTGFNNDFHNFLINNFEHIEINLSTSKSIKEINGSSAFSLNILYTDIKNYNYCEISRGSFGSYSALRTFYFITDVQSENDSAENPSSSINIEYDVWHNNLFELQNNNNFDENFVERCHQNRFVDTGDGFKRIYSSTPENFGSVFTRKKINNSKYNVLWLQLQFDDGVVLNNEEFEQSDLGSAVPLYTKTPIVYIPIFYFLDGVPVTFDFTTNASDIPESDPTILKRKRIYPSTYNLKKYFSILGSINLINANLTYIVPFEYEVSFDEIPIITHLWDNYTTLCTIGNSNDEWNKPSFIWGVCGYIANYAEVDFKNTFKNADVFMISNNSVLSEGDYNRISNPNLSVQKDGESKFFNFPYNYKSLKFNNIEKTLVCQGLIDNLSLIVNKNNSALPTVSFIENGVKNSEQLFINSNGQCITSKEYLDQYLRNNSNKLNYDNLVNSIKIASGSIKTGAGVAMLAQGNPTGINGVLGGFGDLKEGIVGKIEQNVMLEDLQNRQDIISSPTFIAQDDLLFQNNIIEYEYNMYQEDEINKILDFFIRYGYSLNSVKSLRDINRYWYDFVKTRNCFLPFIRNYIEREKIQNIYNNGVTKWHILPSLTAKINFDFMANNPEVNIISEEFKKLPKPTNLSITLNTLRWDYVENATHYKIYFNGQLIITTRALFSNLVGVIPENSTGNITIIATADGYIDSFSSEPIYYTNILTKLSTPSLLTDGILLIDTRSQKLIVEILERNGGWRQILTKETNGNTVALDVRDITYEMSFEEWGSEEVFSSVRVRTISVGYTPSDYYTYINEFDFVWVDNIYNLQGCSLSTYYQDDFRYNKNKIPSISSILDVIISVDSAFTLESGTLRFTDFNGTQFIDTQPIIELSNNVYLFRFIYNTNSLGSPQTTIYYEA